jgi:type IV secretory pathway VirB4 component
MYYYNAISYNQKLFNLRKNIIYILLSFQYKTSFEASSKICDDFKGGTSYLIILPMRAIDEDSDLSLKIYL